MIPRILEPEIMDTKKEAADYDAMDHADVNRRFVTEFLQFAEAAAGNGLSRVLDVGTGTAQIPIEFCRQHSYGVITAIDLSREMLKLAQKNVDTADFSDRIVLQYVDAKQMPFEDRQFDAVISNSIIHHIPEPGSVLSEMKRVLKPEGWLFVRDLLRPDDQATVDQLVQNYAGEENAHQQQMFRDSLHAALTLKEVGDLLHQQGLPADWVKATSDRHWTIAGRLSA